MKKGKVSKISDLDIIKLYVEEYKLIRAEILQSLKNQNLHATVTITFFALVVAFLQYRTSKIIVEKEILIVAYSMIIPILALTLFTLYLREIIKIMKCARGLRRIEAEIHVCYLKEGMGDTHQHPFTWETKFLEQNGHSFVAPLLILFLYISIALISIVYSLRTFGLTVENVVFMSISFIIALMSGIKFIKIIHEELNAINRTMPFGRVKKQ